MGLTERREGRKENLEKETDKMGLTQSREATVFPVKVFSRGNIHRPAFFMK
jgi:hypothetical protein